MFRICSQHGKIVRNVARSMYSINCTRYLQCTMNLTIYCRESLSNLLSQPTRSSDEGERRGVSAHPSGTAAGGTSDNRAIASLMELRRECARHRCACLGRGGWRVSNTSNSKHSTTPRPRNVSIRNTSRNQDVPELCREDDVEGAKTREAARMCTALWGEHNTRDCGRKTMSTPNLKQRCGARNRMLPQGLKDRRNFRPHKGAASNSSSARPR